MVAHPRLLLLFSLALLCGCDRVPSTNLHARADQLRTAILAETGDTNTTLIVDHGNIHIRSAGQTITVNQTKTCNRPESLPADIVLPDDAHYHLWTEAPRGSTLSLLTNLQPDALADYFRQQWPSHSWLLLSDVQADTLRCLTFCNTTRQVAITIEPDPESDPSTRALLFIEPLSKIHSP